MTISSTQVAGAIDSHTRCTHYHGSTDIIAIKFKCCDMYYGCFYCHEELADHAPETWPIDEREARAVLCGQCNSELTITQYLQCEYRCPQCAASFNPGCRHHYHLYFE
ncbi:CHY zinc finger protein [Paenibacillus swuensis]|uniref:CHY zinc finger protein n=1 Tax=Paenibacillus swuensis TaxID=1178515 RepID=UPI0009EE5500|nr:CHY zinc finger protein [Paenibacillus swuensis]